MRCNLTERCQVTVDGGSATRCERDCRGPAGIVSSGRCLLGGMDVAEISKVADGLGECRLAKVQQARNRAASEPLAIRGNRGECGTRRSRVLNIGARSFHAGK